MTTVTIWNKLNYVVYIETIKKLTPLYFEINDTEELHTKNNKYPKTHVKPILNTILKIITKITKAKEKWKIIIN